MVSDEFLSKAEMPFSQWAVTPAPDHLVPDEVKREQKIEDLKNKLDKGPGVLVITHNDADGLGCAAVVKASTEKSVEAVTVSYNGSFEIKDALLTTYHHGARPDIVISDMGADDDEVLEPLELMGNAVSWYDHHQWDDDLRQKVAKTGVTMFIDENECATSLLARSAHNLPDHIEELAEVTKDIDLWIKEDPRSDRLGVMAYALDDDEYIDVVTEHGVDFPDWVDEEIDAQLEENERLEDLAVANHNPTTIGDYVVAYTYIKGGRSSTIGNRLVEEYDSNRDIAVVQRPKGISIYSHSDRETFARCHEVAEELGGGGHPTASGFPIPVDGFHDLAEYWSTSGVSVRREIDEAIAQVVEDG